MIEVLGSPPEVVAFRIRDALDAEDYQEVVDMLDYKLAHQEKVSVYMDLLHLDPLVAQAVAKRVAYVITKNGEWSRFRRVAVVTERDGVSALSRIFSALIPKLEARTFDSGQQHQALLWTAGMPHSEHPPYESTLL